jgi:drug/metabolite transporter (DMT)-like permease
MIDSIWHFGGELAALSGAFLWAIASIAYSRVGENIPPLELNLLKGILALAMLAITLFVTGDALAAGGGLAIGLLLLSGAVGIGLGDTAYFETLRYLGPRRTLLLGNLAPPMAGLLALVFLEETLPLGAWLGVLITVLGVAWVVTERVPQAMQAKTHTMRGVAYGLLAALFQAGGAVLSRAAFIHTSTSPLWAAFLRLAAGVLILLVWILIARSPVGRWRRLEQPRQLWGRLLFAVFTGTYLAIWLQQVSLKLTTAGIAQTLLATSPLFVLPFAAQMGEKISARAILGAGMALLGIGLLFGAGS